MNDDCDIYEEENEDLCCKCGNELDSNYSECDYCESLLCSNCFIIEGTNIYCPYCGKSID